jgi:hypothetical protein
LSGTTGKKNHRTTEDTEGIEKTKEIATDEHGSTQIKELAFCRFYQC